MTGTSVPVFRLQLLQLTSFSYRRRTIVLMIRFSMPLPRESNFIRVVRVEETSTPRKQRQSRDRIILNS